MISTVVSTETLCSRFAVVHLVTSAEAFDNHIFACVFSDYCKDIKVIAILLVVITAAISTSLLFSCCTTLVTSVALCRARSIAVSHLAAFYMLPRAFKTAKTSVVRM